MCPRRSGMPSLQSHDEIKADHKAVANCCTYTTQAWTSADLFACDSRSYLLRWELDMYRCFNSSLSPDQASIARLGQHDTNAFSIMQC